MIRLNKSYPMEKQLKNRSSKHLKWLTGMKNYLRCASNAQLNEWAGKNVPGAAKEQARRQARRDKKGV